MIKAEIVKDSVNCHGKRLTTFVLQYPRYIHAETLTHRQHSRNSSSCLHGDTRIYIEMPSATKMGRRRINYITISDLYKKWNFGDSLGRCMKSRLRDVKVRCLNEESFDFISTGINDVIFSGNKVVYEVELEDGYRIRCTDQHRLFSEKGWTTLASMGLNHGNTGTISWDKNASALATNGFELTKDWLNEQRSLGKSITEISTEFGLNFKQVSYYAEKYGIRFRKLKISDEISLYKDKKWLLEQKEKGYTNGYIATLCNTTEDRVKKSCRKLGVTGFVGTVLKNGKAREPWNTGKTYKMRAEVYESFKNNKSMWKSGPDSPSWKGGIANYKDHNVKVTKWLADNRKKLLEAAGYRCAVTGTRKGLVIHHIDPVWHNRERSFDITNVIVLNNSFHIELHRRNLDLIFLEYFNSHNGDVSGFTIPDYPVEFPANKPRTPGNSLVCRYRKIVNIKYLGVLPTYDLEVTGKYKNFVADGVVVHNSRAIPLKKQIESVLSNPVRPLVYTENKPGMQGGEELPPEIISQINEVWDDMMYYVARGVEKLSALGLHKQYAGRPLECWNHITTVVTATDYDNFFALRRHPDAQPEIHALADAMWEALKASQPIVRNFREWHLPFVSEEEYEPARMAYLEGVEWMMDKLIHKSVACCARVSYKNHFNSEPTEEENEELYNRLIKRYPIHSSPAEHQAMVARSKDYFSGNFTGGWLQYRKLLPNECIYKYVE